MRKSERDLKSIETRIEKGEIDFDGKDSDVNLDKEIEKVQEQIDNLEEISKKKLEEYQAQYKEEQKNSKTIEDHITDFENQTNELYDGFNVSEQNESFYFEENPIKKFLIDSIIKLEFKTGKEINHNDFIKNKDVKDILKDIDFSQIPQDTTITFVNDKEYKKIGGFIDESNSIVLNLAKIGYDVPLFFKTLGHELKHAQQKVEFEKANAKPKEKRSYKDTQIIKQYKLGKKFNQDLSVLYSENKYLSKVIDLIEETHKRTGKSKLEIAKEIKKEDLYKKYDKIFNDYYTCNYETEARNQGKKTERKAIHFEQLQKFKQSSYSRQNFIKRLTSDRPVLQTYKHEVGRIGSSYVERGNNNRGADKEAETIKQTTKQKAENISSAKEANKRATNHIEQWVGDIEKNRYDVNKKLNSLINVTRKISNELKERGIKANDKQLREIMPFLRERTEVPEKLDREDLKKIYSQLTHEDKNRLQKLADDTSEFFNLVG